MKPNFQSLGIRPELQAALTKQGVAVPTPVQEQTIPAAMTGRDVIVQAQTGTGKTLAFLLPLLEMASPDSDHVEALILTPTRELALQITAEVQKLAPFAGLTFLPVYGGQDVEAQAKKLESPPNIVIATPGRLLDHLRRGTISLSRLSVLVLDEADQMLHMGFLPEVEEVIRQTPADRQTMLFSATFPDTVRSLARTYMRQPEDIRVKGRAITLDEIQQIVVETTDRQKRDTLYKLIELYRPYLAVIFCRTKIRAKKLTEALLADGFDADELHGDLTQAKREAVMKRFRNAELTLLVATDVAARGLDVEGVTHVFNYDIPHDAESYIHRIGRTGRAGQKGLAITLAAPRDHFYVQQIEQAIGVTIEKKRMQAADEPAPERKPAPVGNPTPAGKPAGRWERPARTGDGSAERRKASGSRQRRDTAGHNSVRASAKSEPGAPDSRDSRGSKNTKDQRAARNTSVARDTKEMRGASVSRAGSDRNRGAASGKGRSGTKPSARSGSKGRNFGRK